MYDLGMAVMTVSEARAVLPEVLTRVARGEEITITRYGRPIAIVVRPDVVWSQPGTEVTLDETEGLVTALRERARRHGLSLRQEVLAILEVAEDSTRSAAPLPPIRLTTVRTTASSTWSRGEIYADEGR
jgi:antitoxin (DNA-binding transcriptional repressor) of toxin-antitoxin stability system